MGKGRRFMCIALPMALTIGSLVTLALVLYGQTYKSSAVSNDIYFFKANTKDFTANPDTVLNDIPDNVNIDNNLLQALQGVAKSKELKDFYKVGLWNYCEGDIDDKGKETVTFCSPHKSKFWFNPVEVWGLENTTAQKLFNDKLQDGLNTYRKAVQWVFVAFVIAIMLNIGEFVIGLVALCSRWGSLATTIVSTAQTVVIIVAASAATGIYAVLAGVFQTVLRPYKIKASLGTTMLAILWIGVAASLASTFFWLISVCYCSGESRHKRTHVEKTPYTYERVASPYLGAREGDHQLGNLPSPGHGTSGHAFEPYRQQHV